MPDFSFPPYVINTPTTPNRGISIRIPIIDRVICVGVVLPGRVELSSRRNRYKRERNRANDGKRLFSLPVYFDAFTVSPDALDFPPVQVMNHVLPTTRDSMVTEVSAACAPIGEMSMTL